VLRHVHDAEDACQAAFLVLGRKAASIRNRESVAGWLHGVAFRVAARLRRDVNRRRAREEPAVDVAAPDRSGELTWREVRAALDEELNALPECYRAPLVLCYLEGRTRDEAARQLGWGLTTLRGRLERGRAQLRARLLRCGLSLSAAWLAAALAPAARGIEVARMGTAASVSTRAAALAEEVVKAMTTSKVTLVAWVLLTVGVLGAGAGVLSRQGRNAVPAAARPAAQAEDDRLRKEVEQLRKQNAELKRLLMEVRDKVNALETGRAIPKPPREVVFKGKPVTYWLEQLRDRDPDTRREALGPLGAIGTADARVVPALLGTLKDRAEDVRSAAIRALEQVADPKTVPALEACLKDSNGVVRGEAAWALAVVGGAKTAPLLAKVLEDPHQTARLGAARALVRLGADARAAAPALARTLADPQDDVRNEVQAALVRIGPAAVPALAGVLRDKDAELRRRAAEVLVGGGADAVPLLIKALNDPTWEVRNQSALSLGSLGSKDRSLDLKAAVSALAVRLRDPVAAVRQAAASALGKLGPVARTAVSALLRAYEDRADSKRDLDKYARSGAAQALWQLDPAAAARAAVTVHYLGSNRLLEGIHTAVPALIAAVKNGDVQTRAAAVRVLGTLGRAARDAAPALTRALADEDETVRAAARKALDQINDP
jgi:RNA polymerase sigma factor (sigma-70 family)